MSVKKIASRYAKSLLDLAVERGQEERVMADVQVLKKVNTNRDFALLLKSPVIKSDKKQKVFDAIFADKLDLLTRSFMGIMIRKGRESLLPAILDEFTLQYKILKHVSTVTLTTATPLSAEVTATIQNRLVASKETDTHVELLSKVNPDIIGGFVLEFDGKLYDASVSHKLDTFKQEFDKNLYIKDF